MDFKVGVLIWPSTRLTFLDFSKDPKNQVPPLSPLASLATRKPSIKESKNELIHFLDDVNIETNKNLRQIQCLYYDHAATIRVRHEMSKAKDAVSRRYGMYINRKNCKIFKGNNSKQKVLKYIGCSLSADCRHLV